MLVHAIVFSQHVILYSKLTQNLLFFLALESFPRVNTFGPLTSLFVGDLRVLLLLVVGVSSSETSVSSYSSETVEALDGETLVQVKFSKSPTLSKL